MPADFSTKIILYIFNAIYMYMFGYMLCTRYIIFCCRSMKSLKPRIYFVYIGIFFTISPVCEMAGTNSMLYIIKTKLQLFIDVHERYRLIRLHIVQKRTSNPYLSHKTGFSVKSAQRLRLKILSEERMSIIVMDRITATAVNRILV